MRAYALAIVVAAIPTFAHADYLRICGVGNGPNQAILPWCRKEWIPTLRFHFAKLKQERLVKIMPSVASLLPIS